MCTRLTVACGARKEFVEQVLGQHSHLPLQPLVEQQARGNGRPVGAPSPPPLARMEDAVLNLHCLQSKGGFGAGNVVNNRDAASTRIVSMADGSNAWRDGPRHCIDASVLWHDASRTQLLS